jgi:uncharacterized protein YfbU (UPF0304 family)
MQSKSERFEMRVDQQTIDRVDEWRGEQTDFPSRAEAIRRLVDKALSTSKSDDQTDFRGADKLIISMLCEIHPAFKERPELDPRFIREALLGGHNWALRWRYPGTFEPYRDDETSLHEVVDILDMWSFVERGYENLSAEDKDRVKKEAHPFGEHVQFTGFDGNYETNQMGIARFLVEKLDRFSEFEGRGFNSHAPSLDAYRRMLRVFLPMRNTLTGGRMSAKQIIAVLTEQTHPDYRS